MPAASCRARSWRMHKGRPLLLLEGVTDRNDIEALRGQKILVDRDLLPLWTKTRSLRGGRAGLCRHPA